MGVIRVDMGTIWVDNRKGIYEFIAGSAMLKADSEDWRERGLRQESNIGRNKLLHPDSRSVRSGIFRPMGRGVHSFILFYQYFVPNGTFYVRFFLMPLLFLVRLQRGLVMAEFLTPRAGYAVFFD